jgi:uncharacterized protein YndB with AHSA1/START domain
MSMTINRPAVIDTGEFTVRRTITIAAPVAKVWAAITEPAQISRWLPQSAVLDGSGVGASGTFSWPGNEVPVRIEAIDPQRSITYRWSNDDASDSNPAEVDVEHSTVFEFTLEATSDGTQLTVVESGFDTTSDPAFNMDAHRGGWDAELDELVAYLEGGS